MKLQMKKNQLLNVLNKMVDVATKAIKSDEESVGRVTIEVDPKQVSFKASNGYLNAIYTVTPEQDSSISKSETGVFTVDAVVFRNVVKAMATKSEDSVAIIDMEGDMLKILEAGSKLKKHATLQVLSSHHDFRIDRPTKGVSLKFETDIFCRGINRVAPFVSKLGYDISFQMICLHVFPDQTRYVCGDGGCFAIYEYPQKNNVNADGVECLIPVNQSFILENLLAGIQDFELILKKGEYYFASGPVVARLQGVPVDEYVNYSQHAYQQDKATAVFDMETKDLIDAMTLVGAVKGKDTEVQGSGVHTFKLRASADGVNILVDSPSAKYRCDIDKPCNFYKMSKDTFQSEYAHCFVRDIASAVVDPQIRFFCISEDQAGVLVAESVKVNSALGKDAKGIPLADRPDKDRFLFFFAATIDSNA